jgi:hypothetical protein
MNHDEDRVTQLRQELVVGEYRVNADAVARAMLSKLRLASLSHRVLGIRRDVAVAPVRPSAHA